MSRNLSPAAVVHPCMPLAFPAAPARRLRRLLLPALLVAASPLGAQVRLVDEGSFTVTRGEERLGREDFSIRSTPGVSGDTVLVAQGTVARGEQRLLPALSTGRTGAARSYQVEVRRGEATVERWSAQVAGGRMSARVQTPTTEAAREWLVAEGAPVVDLDVFHHLHFLARSGRTGDVPVVVPRRGAQERWRVTVEGADPVSIAGRLLPARRLAITDGTGERILAWLDDEHRVLRVELPRRGVVAVREDAPR